MRENIPTEWTETPEDVTNFDKMHEETLEALKHMNAAFGSGMSDVMNDTIRKDAETTWEYFIRHTQRRGPRPIKGGYCGFCNSITPRERKKFDSCPECGKSYLAYRGGKW